MSDAATAAKSEDPWCAVYDPHVPAVLSPALGNMLAVFDDAVARDPDAPALLYFNQTISYGELDRQSDAIACWLQDCGIGHGDRVQIVAQNIPAFPIACVAAWKVGAIPVPGNPMYRATELARIFADAEPAAVLCQDCDINEVQAGLELAGRSSVPLIVASPRNGVAPDPGSMLPPSAEVNHGKIFEEIVLSHDGRAPSPVAVEPKDLGLILYTSGTTGAPKGAMLTHANMAFNAEATCIWFPLGAEDRILAIAPFFHITGMVCHIAAAFRAGCAMVINYRFEPNVVVDMIRAYRPTFTIGAITAFNALMRVEAVTREDMTSLAKVWSGGAPIPPTLREEIERRLGLVVHNSYGMTELTSPVILTPPAQDGPIQDGVLSLGVPIPSTEMRVVDEHGAELPHGSAGELLFRGPQVMAGYWRKPDESAAALSAGWMHTGDIGFRDDTGWVYLIDRKKDVIIASGFKVWPREVEDVLYAHPAIREVAVVGVPDSYRGETVKACVSLSPGASVTEAELVSHCRQHLAAYKVPRVVAVLDELPKTVSGKIQRAALRESLGA